MEKDVQIGSVGALKLSLAAGKAVVEIDVQASALSGGVAGQASASATVDSAALLDLLFTAIESKSPAGAVAIEEGVKSALKMAVAAIQ